MCYIIIVYYGCSIAEALLFNAALINKVLAGFSPVATCQSMYSAGKFESWVRAFAQPLICAKDTSLARHAKYCFNVKLRSFRQLGQRHILAVACSFRHLLRSDRCCLSSLDSIVDMRFLNLGLQRRTLKYVWSLLWLL